MRLRRPRKPALAVGVLAVLLLTLSLAPGTPAAATGQISGKVTEAAAPHNPIAGIEVCAFPSGSENVGPETIGPENIPCATTDAVGEYTISGVPSGEYTAEFFIPAKSPLNYITQYYNDKSSESAAEPVLVSAPNTTANIDAQLTVGGQISGVVTDASTGAPIEGTLVCAFPVVGEIEGCAVTGSGGSYTISGLASGEYRVVFLGQKKYLLQYYNAKIGALEANLVQVTQGSLTTGINAALQPGTGSIVPVNITPPTGPGRPPLGGPTPTERPLLRILGSKVILSKGSLRVRVKCTRAPCKGRLVLFTLEPSKASEPSKGHRAATCILCEHPQPEKTILADGTFSLARNTTSVVILKLTHAGRTRLAHVRRRPLRREIIVVVRGGNQLSKSVLVS